MNAIFNLFLITWELIDTYSYILSGFAFYCESSKLCVKRSTFFLGDRELGSLFDLQHHVCVAVVMTTSSTFNLICKANIV